MQLLVQSSHVLVVELSKKVIPLFVVFVHWF